MFFSKKCQGSSNDKKPKAKATDDSSLFLKIDKKIKKRQQRTFPATVFSQDKENPLPLDIF
ncbi:hypothetical protein ZMO1_ZMO2048 [Zymomonas mobilis subsp. mobilis ZM4 = ATCC 31821]|nr:hypothetical protein ZMO1_ZMO2048 [Zymomonas mobilis subsp. mobilis ZM4 = ATCC 31821]HCE36879.1 hypothetical protein [Zymomonas mobilis]